MKYAILCILLIVVGFLVDKILGFVILAAMLLFAIYSYVPVHYATKGNKAFARGDDKETLLWYEKAVNTKRASLVIRISYAFILLKTGNPEKAETVLNEILLSKHIPVDKRNLARQNRCMVHYKLGRLDEAIEEAEDLFQTYRNSSVYGMIGYFKILNGDDLDETLAFCLEAYDFNSDDRDILDNLSIVYYKRGEYDKAKEISDKLIETAPKFIEAFYHGAQICEKCGEFDKGLELLENIEDCKRSYLTTVSEQEIEDLRKRLQSNK